MIRARGGSDPTAIIRVCVHVGDFDDDDYDEDDDAMLLLLLLLLLLDCQGM